MRCLFCKANSTASRSVEHIIPESLGNSLEILPRGVVCDRCNNYFARKVEAPFLESGAVKGLRFHQAIENKRGRIPSLAGIVSRKFPALVTQLPRQNMTSITVSPEVLPTLANEKQIELILPVTGAGPSDAIIGRFFAKVALESMAKRLVAFPEGLSYLCDEAQLDPIRHHARYGGSSAWPVHIRTIYDADAWTLDESGHRIQVIHESDFLVTSMGEWYFILAIFGLEFAINIGAPSVEGYVNWLVANQGLSPLYSGRNSGSIAMPS